MPTNPFPLDIIEKINSPELLAFFEQFGEENYLSAEEINLIFAALNYLYTNGGGGGGGIETGSTQLQQNNITFKKNNGDFFGTVTAPRTGVLTFDMTDAITGGNAVVYYQNATLQMPSTWLTVGVFAPNVLNKIYLERDSEGYITANILNVSTVPPADTTPPSTIGTLTITNEDITPPADTTPPSTIGTLTIINE
jgi:hypothetical protein